MIEAPEPVHPPGNPDERSVQRYGSMDGVEPGPPEPFFPTPSGPRLAPQPAPLGLGAARLGLCPPEADVLVAGRGLQ